MLERERGEQYRERMTCAAFTAYLGGAGGKECKTFDKYIKRLGLKEKIPDAPIHNKEAAKKRALEIAERIIKADKEQYPS